MGMVGVHYGIWFTLYIFGIPHDMNLKQFLEVWETEMPMGPCRHHWGSNELASRVVENL